MRASRLWKGFVFAAVTCLGTTPVFAQMPPDPTCYCLKQSVDATQVDMVAKQQAFSASQTRLNELDSQLNAARGQVNVNDPQAVAQFRQMLSERDQLFRQSSGDLITADQAATAAYNQAVANYNNQCAGRPLPPPPPGPLVCR